MVLSAQTINPQIIYEIAQNGKRKKKQIVAGGKGRLGKSRNTATRKGPRLSLEYHSSPNSQVTSRSLNVLIAC